MSWLFWLFILILLITVAGAAYWAYRVFVAGDAEFNPAAWLFRPRPEPRLGISEQATLDSRRRLVLIRRDNVEHLIMTGGPVDVVIETGIAVPTHAHVPAQPPELESSDSGERSPPVFRRTPRSLGQAVNE